MVQLVSCHACGSAPVKVTRWGLRIGGDDTIFALLSTFAQMKEVSRLAQELAPGSRACA